MMKDYQQFELSYASNLPLVAEQFQDPYQSEKSALNEQSSTQNLAIELRSSSFLSPANSYCELD